MRYLWFAVVWIGVFVVTTAILLSIKHHRAHRACHVQSSGDAKYQYCR